MRAQIAYVAKLINIIFMRILSAFSPPVVAKYFKDIRQLFFPKNFY